MSKLKSQISKFNNPIQIIKKLVYQSVFSIANKDRIELSTKDIELTHPTDFIHGDYSTNIALKLSNKLGKSPQEIAEKIQKTIYKDKKILKNKIIDRVEVIKPGFLNFFLSKDYLLSELNKIIQEKDNYGRAKEKTGKRLMVEYAHPNTHKIFHIGHLRNISIGESIVRLLEASGNEVISVNYQGDVGLHIAKCLWAIKKVQSSKFKVQGLKTLEDRIQFLGKAYAEGAKAYQESQEAKEEIHKINKQIYARDPQIKTLWETTRQWSLDYFSHIYQRVGTHYDRFYFESEVQNGLEIAKKAFKKGILESSEGAIIFNGEKYGLDTRVFINSLGLPTYEGKELGLAELEFSEFGVIDKCIHVVGPEQKSFFSVTFKVEELLDAKKFKGKQYHLVYAHVVLKEGKMSSREGKVIAGNWLLDEGKKKAGSLIKDGNTNDQDKEKTAECVGIGAVKYGMLKYSPQTQIKFNFEESVSLEGNSGPYLQYTYVRIKSILSRANFQFPSFENTQDKIFNFQTISNDEISEAENEILRTIYKFSEVVKEATDNFAPNLICNFLFDLAQKYNKFYNDYPIIRSEIDSRDFRLLLTKDTGQIIKNGLYLLGIEVPEKM